MKLPFIETFFKSEENRKKFSTIVIPSFAVHVIAALLGFTLIFVLTRTLGAREYGIYTYAISVATILINLFSYGITVMAVRETSSLLSQNKTGLWKGFYKWALSVLSVVCFVLTAMVALAITVFTYVFHIWKEGPYTSPILCALIIVPFFGLMNYYSALLRGNHKTVASTLPDNIVKPLTFLILLIITILFFGKLSALHALFLNIGGVIVGFIFAFYIFNRSRPKPEVQADYDSAKWKKTLFSFFYFQE